MQPPQRLLTLAIVLLGASSSTSASPAPLSVPTSSTTDHNTPSYLYYDTHYNAHALSHFARGNDIITFPNGDFEAGCRFVAQGRAYNICALLYKFVQVGATLDDEGPIPKGKGKGKAKEMEREITVFLASAKGTKHFESCPEGARTCFIEREGSSSRAIPAERNEEKGSPTPPVFVGNFRDTGRKFDLWINSRETSVRFILTCGGGGDDLEYVEMSEELRVLKWQTRHACPLGSTSTYTATEAEEDDSSTPDGEPSAESPGTELKEDLPVGGVSRKLLGFLLFLAVFALAVASVLISSPQARHYALAHIQYAGYTILPHVNNLKHLTRPVAKHFPNFKVGERRLVQWAQEDMVLNGDEDFMINGSGSGHRGWGDLETTDEYIPLKSSPVWYAHSRTTTGSSQVSASWSYSTYGSVAFEGLDVDDSEVNLGPPPEGGMKRFIRSASETATTRVKQIFRR